MTDSLYLAWQYLRFQRLTASVLIAAITLIMFLPVALQVIVGHAEHHLRARATETPLLIGPRGSELELVLASLYFDRAFEPYMRWAEFGRVSEQALGLAIPLHTRFTTRGCQVVGTTLDYLSSRRLEVVQGAYWNLLGECVVGSAAATRLGAKLGDRLPVVSENAFVLDSPPLRLRVAGILAATDTPDDEAIFVDIDTAWVIEGLGHGHAERAPHGSTATYTDITEQNVAEFHFHGDRSTFPLTAIMVLPNDEKAETLLLGQYLSPDETVQMVRPQEIMENLLRRILMVRSYMVVAIGIVSMVTLLTMALVMVLSIRLRHAEITTMTKMGCSRHRIASILGMEIVLLLVVSATLAALLVGATSWFGPQLVRWLVL